MKLPCLRPDGAENPARSAGHDAGVLLVVYAPFGGDPVLSRFPEGASQELSAHPMVQSLLKVAACGVHVMALVDRHGEDTSLLHLPAGDAAGLRVVSRWKQDMASPHTLAGLLQHAARAHPGASLVLALEGHGAGFLPELDRRQLTPEGTTGGGTFEWRIGATSSAPVRADGSPVLPGGFPQLPGGFPQLPAEQMPMSTFGVGRALALAAEAGVPPVSVIHFNNCFNMSVELLHAVAPHARHAAGYINYNFFTAGVTYPAVFERLKAQGSATGAELAAWFARENGELLAAKGHHPSVGCSIELARLAPITERLDDLADALLAALRTGDAAQRSAFVARIRAAIIRAQQLDANFDMQLETPDPMTDLLSLAHELQAEDFGAFAVRATAKALERALDLDAAGQPAPIKRYGATDQPWTAPGALWDFSSNRLALNIFLPDPLRQGLWDWRAPYYMSVNPTPVQPEVIDFLQVTDWVDFLIEYHRDTPFVGLLAPRLPVFPVFNRHADRLHYPEKPVTCRPGHEPRKSRAR